MEINRNSLEFSVISNVEIYVENRKRKLLKKFVTKHNKATRNMVTGLLRFMTGHFTASIENSKPYYSDTEQYIPCHIGLGYGGVRLDQDGMPIVDAETRIPSMDPSWNSFVKYSSKKLAREFDCGRTKIRKVGQTYTEEDTAGDMDTVYFYCEISPGTLNSLFNDMPVVVSEVGLFAGEIQNKEDLLAYVKLANKTDEQSGETKTDTLYVRSEDTIVIKWYITIAAVGQDGIFTGKEEQVQMVSSVGTVQINEMS